MAPTTDGVPVTREGLADAVRDRAWAYLSAVADPTQIASIAEDLFRLPRGDLRRLAAIHVGISPEATLMLEGAEAMLRELPSSVSRSIVELRGAVRPPIAWRETQQRRLQTGDRSIFVCAPPERRYDTPLARLVRLALHQCVALHIAAAMNPRGGVGATLSRQALTAARLQRHAKLRDVRLVSSLPSHALNGARRYPVAAAVVDFVNLYREAVEDQSPATVREVVTRRLLVPGDPDRLFELYVGLEIVSALEAAGFERSEHRLFVGRGLPFATLRRGSEEMTLWYQRSVANVDGFPDGRYVEVLSSAKMSRSSLRPDFILMTKPRSEMLLVEVKFTARDIDTADRVGIKDVFTYLHDSGASLAARPSPRALVVGWDSTATPTPADVVVSSQSAVRDAIALTLKAWEGAA